MFSSDLLHFFFAFVVNLYPIFNTVHSKAQGAVIIGRLGAGVMNIYCTI